MRRAEAASMEGVIDLTGDDDDKDKKTAAAQKKKKAAPQKKAGMGGTNNTTKPAKKQATNNGVRSAAAINAGKAAANRFNAAPAKKTLDQTHPNVQLPEKLSNKTKEEQILRCAHRVKTHVMAVDTLLRVLTSVRNAPNNPKFRTIDRTNGNYVKFVRDKPGAEDLLLAMNYRRSGNNELRLERHLVDDALLYLGISALEQMRLTDEYITAKKDRAFHAEMKRVAQQNGANTQLSTGMTDAETAIRIEYMSKCPKEPPEGRGAWVYVHLGDEKGQGEKIEGGQISRRFDGDDTLEDVLNWIGGCYGSEVLDKIRGRSTLTGDERERVWCLCDLNRYPILPLDVEKHSRKTLQYLGLFPSGKLGVRLSDDAWRERREGENGPSCEFPFHGSARGLGAASRSMLH